MTIEVLICTCGKGILDVPNVLSRKREDVSYLVSFQYASDADKNLIPDELKSRDDVRIYCFNNSGLSVNRNQALRMSKGDILLFADDDNCYTDGDFDRLLYTFRECPDKDIICFRSADYDGKLNRTYPTVSFSLEKMPRGYFVRSNEIAVRGNNKYPAFDEHYGLGSEYLAAGEDEIFIHDAIVHGLKVWFFPMTIVSSDSSTTGTKFNSLASVRRSKGAVLAALHGRTGAVLRVIKFALVHVKGMSRVQAFHDMMDGIAYARKIGRC